MSNPAVIFLSILSSSIPRKVLSIFQRKRLRRFQVEDNIGESIHIHFDDLRFDLSIDEFDLFVNDFQNAFYNYIDAFDKNLKYIDPEFLYQIAPHIKHIKSVNFIKKNIQNLNIIEYKNLKFSIFKICK